jgi:hypothetical protein
MKDDENQGEDKSFLDKLEEMDIEKLRFQMQYLPCIDDTLQSPLEIWYYPETNTMNYFKLYVGGITIIVKTIDSVFEEFEVIEGDFDYVNSLRRGVLIHCNKI